MSEFGALIIGGWGSGGTQGLEAAQQMLGKKGIPSQLHFLPTSEGNVVSVEACQDEANRLVQNLVSQHQRRIILAYSLGAMFVVDAASKLAPHQEIDLAVFVAPWTNLKPTSPGYNFEDRKQSAKRIVNFTRNLDWQGAVGHLPNVKTVFSSNDYFVDQRDEVNVMRAYLGAENFVKPRKGHFLKGQFPLVGKIVSNYLEEDIFYNSL